MTITQRLERFPTSLTPAATGADSRPVGENTAMAGTVLAILPLFLMFIIAQRYFTQSIDRRSAIASNQAHDGHCGDMNVQGQPSCLTHQPL